MLSHSIGAWRQWEACLNPTPSMYPVHHLESYKFPCHIDTEGMSLSRQAGVPFVQIIRGPHVRGDPKKENIHIVAVSINPWN
ncbi:hypothetical protein TNCV_537831 [Trichonephila clavipes]|nr:hypothetical protein TNCV_537831 [Trichonephila clavipes]